MYRGNVKAEIMVAIAEVPDSEEKQVFLWIVRNTNKSGLLKCTQRDAARKSGIRPRAVQAVFKKLMEEGYLINRRPGLYQLSLPQYLNGDGTVI